MFLYFRSAINRFYIFFEINYIHYIIYLAKVKKISVFVFRWRRAFRVSQKSVYAYSASSKITQPLCLNERCGLNEI